MTQKLCPACAAQNPLENRFCGQCVSRLDQPLVAPRRQELAIGRGSSLPAPALKQVGRAAAASLAAIAAEAALAWLRRRAGSDELAPPVRQQGREPEVEKLLPAKASPLSSGPPLSSGRSLSPGRVSAIFGRRIVRRWQHGSRGQETVEEEVWWYES